jgi:hypothetical protein
METVLGVDPLTEFFEGIHSPLTKDRYERRLDLFLLFAKVEPSTSCSNPCTQGTEIGITLWQSSSGYGACGSCLLGTKFYEPFTINGKAGNIKWDPEGTGSIPERVGTYLDIVNASAIPKTGTISFNLSDMLRHIQSGVQSFDNIPGNYYFMGIELGTEFGQGGTSDLNGFYWTMNNFDATPSGQSQIQIV